MEKSKLYTRSGDKGKTSLIGGKRVPKTHIRIEAYGTLDELNAQLGFLSVYLTEEIDRANVLRIQNNLFALGTYLAIDSEASTTKSQYTLSEEEVTALEMAIDKTIAPIPPCNGFILPRGKRGAAVGHICRTVCRRAERRIIELSYTVEIDPQVLIYINRLSDYLFALARKVNFLAGQPEIIWQNDGSCQK